MKRIGTWGLVAAAALILAACGGGNDNLQRMVSFGDSLSDVGSYRSPGVASVGGGKYTVNAPDAQIWVERLASRLGLPAPCAAQTGLEASGPLAAFAAPIVNVPDCFAYGQGGSRVTNPVGVANKALLPSSSGLLGQLTSPVVNQVSRHLTAVGGLFRSDDLVLVWAGANDLFVAFSVLQATVGAGGDATAAAQVAIASMAQAGRDLAAQVKDQMVAKGARRVVVINLPDVTKTPFGLPLDAQTKGLVALVASEFNAQLEDGLRGVNGVLQIDAFAEVNKIVADPAAFGLTNVTDRACNFAVMPVPTSLFCSNATTVAGDVSRFLWADDVHLTPFGYQLVADIVEARLKSQGWL